MIPTFPSFKKIELADKNEIEEFVSNFPPYSAFNFTNIFAWDIWDDRKVSKLNGNLIMIFTDYETKEPFISFIGINKCEETIIKLLKFANESKISTSLRFITEESIECLKDNSDLLIMEDRNNFDYIFSPSQLAKYKGIKFKKHRHLARKFLQDYPDAIFELKDLSDLSIQNEIYKVLRQWEYQKKKQCKLLDLKFEEKALNRLLKNAADHKLILSCIFLHNKMLGFSIEELLPNKNAMSHFIKADNSFRGIYEYLNQELAKHLESKNVLMWNWQQDLNLKNLRETKLGYRPISFLKRFTVSFGNIYKNNLNNEGNENIFIQKVLNN